MISPIDTIDRILKSMEGPDDATQVSIWAEPGKPELLWMTGYRAVMTKPDGETSGVDQDAMAAMFLYLRATDLYDFDFRPSKK